VHEPAAPSDGFRVLVDRLWPRGVSKERAKLGAWAKDLAPSTELRVWFHHDQPLFAEFRRLYISELDACEAQLAELRGRAQNGTVTLVYGAQNDVENGAAVLAEVLRGSVSGG
jgi:uncharacterized protein YeaO (DUF488 family)